MGLTAVVELGFVEAALDAALAVGQFLAIYLGFTRNPSAVLCVESVGYSSNTGKRRGISSFL